VKAVARLARLAVPNVVGKDDEVSGRVQQLPGTKENTAKLRGQESASAAPSAVEDEYGISHYPSRIPARRPERAAVKLQFGHFLTALKAEAANRELSLDGNGLLRRGREGASAQQK
jgi:hypothetical protein